MAILLSDSSISNILEKIIRPAIEEQLYKKTLLFAAMQKNAGITNMSNNSFYIPIRTGRHSGVVAITEGNNLQNGKPTILQAQVSAKWETGTFQISKQTLAVKDSGAVVNILKEYGRLLERDIR